MSDISISIVKFALAGLSLLVCWTLLTDKSFEMYKEGSSSRSTKPAQEERVAQRKPIGRKEFVVDYEIAIYTAACKVFPASW